MSDRLREDAVQLEVLFPRILRILFHHPEQDPLGHLSMAQLRMMRLLYTESSMTSEVSADLNMTPSAVSQTASRLEKMGLVQRVADPNDRRVRRLVLSDEGMRRMKERQSLRVDRAQSALAAISPAHRRRLIVALEELLEAIGGQPIPPDSLAMVAELEQSLPTVPMYQEEEQPIS